MSLANIGENYEKNKTEKRSHYDSNVGIYSLLLNNLLIHSVKFLKFFLKFPNFN